MIKKLFLLAALILPLCASAQTLKIGLVDVNGIISKMPETTAAQNTISEMQKKYQAEFQKIEEEFQRQYEEFQNMKEDELPAIKERKARQLQETQQKADAYQQNVIQDLQKEQERLMTPIMQKVRSAIESVGQEKKFNLIQDITQQIYFSAPVEDITQEVMQKLGL